MIDIWEMGTERNESSVLAKLMGIDKPSPPYVTRRRHRVLSENYLQNIALIAKRKKTLSYSDDADLYMDDIEDSNEFSQRVGVVEHQDSLARTRQSFLFGRSYSSSYSSSGDMKQTKPVFERSNGVHFQDKRTNSSFNSMKSPIQESLPSQETAKQVTGQVMHSVWHSYAELSRSRPSTEKSSNIEEEGKLTSSACFVESKKKLEASLFDPVKGSTSRETRKAKKQLSEKWSTRKCCQDEMLITSSDGNYNSAFTASVNGWPVHAGRYLSKSVLFPSAWIPRSRARDFTLDKNWCLRQEKMDSGLEEENFGHKDQRSTPESIVCSLDLQKPYIHQEISLIIGAKNSSEETLTVTESLSNMSAFSGSEIHMNHKAHKILIENGCGHQQKDVSQDKTVDCLLLSCNFAPLSLGSGDVADEEIKNRNKSAKLWRENLSAKEAACILLGDRDSWKHQCQNKSNASEPGSPVSSLEGPEACRHVPICSVETEEQLAGSDSENDAHELQRKHQLINTMSLESGSEGPGMVVSSEEGDDGASASWNQKDPQIMEINQTWTEESCDFSYIVDIVVDSGLHMRNLEKESKTWFLQGYVLEPLVFELLEKKYGKHVPWEKSGRKLLFDRINSGLFEMVKPPYVGLSSWRKPVSKRLSQRQNNRELIEDELWGLLVKQEEDVKRESYDKVCRNEMEWLDLEEDTSLIAQEIQSLLLGELIEEFVGMETSFC